MTQNDKKLLIRDLCARLPYGVIVYLKYDENTYITREMGLGSLHDIMFDSAAGNPYLRPMSSMSEEEIDELKELCTMYETSDSPNIGFEDYGIRVLPHHLSDDSISFLVNMKVIDWLNAHHFDYRGLIEKGLAIEAPEEMYKK